MKPLIYLDGVKLYYENGVMLGEVFAMEDGFTYFWPITNGGAWSGKVLQAIADLLEKKNAPWEAELKEAFSKIGQGEQGEGL